MICQNGGTLTCCTRCLGAMCIRCCPDAQKAPPGGYYVCPMCWEKTYHKLPYTVRFLI